MTDLTVDQFLAGVFGATFDGTVVTATAEDGFVSRRWRSGKPPMGQSYFCISTVRDSNPRARALQRQTEDLVATHVIVLDDVGTKVEAFRIAANVSYIVETSPDNFQYGFILKPAAAPLDAEALIQAISDAGLTDAGSRRADRIMRLPGSLNAKHDPPFQTRVVAWNPDVTYSAIELAHALGVTPAAARSSRPLVASLGDDDEDPVLTWLAGHGVLLGDRNARGWYPMTCPWQDLHTGEVDHGTDYAPGKPGAFKCLHGHCAERSTSDLRAWILEQDPGAQLGSMADTEVADVGLRLAAALGVRITPPQAGDRAQGDKASGSTGMHRTDVLGLLQGQLEGSIFDRPGRPTDIRRAVLGDLTHVASEDAYWSVETRCLISHKAVDDRWYARMRGAGLLDSVTPAGNPTVIAPHVWLRRQPDTMRASRIVHRLGQPLVVDGCLNIAPAPPKRLDVAGDPEPWLELLSFICKGITADRDHVVDWCSMVVSAWDEKPGWHLLLRGEHGTGKNLAVRPLVKYTKPDHCQNVNASDIGGSFNVFLTKRLVVIDELKMTTRGSITGHDVYNSLKAWTARGADTVTVNEKNRTPYEVADRTCWVITSNEDVPLPLEKGDRRFIVIETPDTPWSIDRYLSLVAWMDAGGDQVVVSWLQDRWDQMPEARRQILRGRAPDTAAKQDLIEASAEGITGAVRLAIAGTHGQTWPDLMRLEDVVEKLKAGAGDLLTDSGRKQVSQQRVIPALKAAGAVRVFGGEVVKYGDRTMRLWCTRPQKLRLYEQLGQGIKLIEKYDEQRTANVPVAFRGLNK